MPLTSLKDPPTGRSKGSEGSLAGFLLEDFRLVMLILSVVGDIQWTVALWVLVVFRVFLGVI